MTIDFIDLSTLHAPTRNTRPGADWGAAINDNFAWLQDRPFAHVYDSTDHSFTTGVENTLSFTDVRADTYDMVDLAADATVITIRRSGLYWISFALDINQNGTAVYAGVRDVDTNIILAIHQFDPNSGNSATAMAGSTLVNMDDGDRLKLIYFADGTAPNVDAPINHLSALWLGEKASAAFP